MPITWKQHEKSLSEPGLCELLPIRDYLDDVMIRMSGEFVAGYVLKGAVSYFADDAGLSRFKQPSHSGDATRQRAACKSRYPFPESVPCQPAFACAARGGFGRRDNRKCTGRGVASDGV